MARKIMAPRGDTPGRVVDWRAGAGQEPGQRGAPVPGGRA